MVQRQSSSRLYHYTVLIFSTHIRIFQWGGIPFPSNPIEHVYIVLFFLLRAGQSHCYTHTFIVLARAQLIVFLYSVLLYFILSYIYIYSNVVAGSAKEKNNIIKSSPRDGQWKKKKNFIISYNKIF